MLTKILICLALVIPALIILIKKIITEKYENFIENNSIALKEIKEINKKYHFYSCKDENFNHSYDNRDFFDNISCEDYLIYQLQSYQYDILKKIKSIKYNKINYEKYCKEVNLINCFNSFKISTKYYNLKRLSSFEKKLFKDCILTPKTDFIIKVTLNFYKKKDEQIESKNEEFDLDEILSLINRLNDKNRDFYNDREIWNSLCRVERGKVSNKLRFKIYERDNHRCRNCGISDDYENLEIDHIIPISKGGKSIEENLQTLCKSCNKQKGNTYIKKD